MTQFMILGAIGLFGWIVTVLVFNAPPWPAFQGIGFWVIVLSVVCIVYEKWQAKTNHVVDLENRVRELERRK
jgi:hypothetical protein